MFSVKIRNVTDHQAIVNKILIKTYINGLMRRIEPLILKALAHVLVWPQGDGWLRHYAGRYTGWIGRADGTSVIQLYGVLASHTCCFPLSGYRY